VIGALLAGLRSALPVLPRAPRVPRGPALTGVLPTTGRGLLALLRAGAKGFLR
jgi:hypothetical protein